MTQPLVYLAGPIAGCSFAGATDWRDFAVEVLDSFGIKGLSPMRAKEYLRNATRKLEHPYSLGTRVNVFGGKWSGRVVGHGETGVSYYIEQDGLPGSQIHVHRSEADPLSSDIGFSATCEEYGHLSPLSGPRGIMTRDRFDATRCDVLLVNLLGATKVSIGTVMEIAWADLCRTPAVVCIEADGSNVHEHCMVNEATGFRCGSLNEGLRVVRSILA